MGRNPTRSELASIDEVLRRLREHFHEWSAYEGHEHALVGFAYYEGCGDSRCCGAILAEAAPIALGAELVRRHGFRWVMLEPGARSPYGVTHPALAGPIDLGSFENETWTAGTSDEWLSRGEATHDALARIVESVGGRPPDE